MIVKMFKWCNIKHSKWPLMGIDAWRWFTELKLKVLDGKTSINWYLDTMLVSHFLVQNIHHRCRELRAWKHRIQLSTFADDGRR